MVSPSSHGEQTLISTERCVVCVRGERAPVLVYGIIQTMTHWPVYKTQLRWRENVNKQTNKTL